MNDMMLNLALLQIVLPPLLVLAHTLIPSTSRLAPLIGVGVTYALLPVYEGRNAGPPRPGSVRVALGDATRRTHQ